MSKSRGAVGRIGLSGNLKVRSHRAHGVSVKSTKTASAAKSTSKKSK